MDDNIREIAEAVRSSPHPTRVLDVDCWDGAKIVRYAPQTEPYRLGLGNPLANLRGEEPLEPAWEHPRIFSHLGLAELVAAHGFTDVHVVGAGYYPFPSAFAHVDPRPTAPSAPRGTRPGRGAPRAAPRTRAPHHAARGMLSEPRRGAGHPDERRDGEARCHGPEAVKLRDHLDRGGFRADLLVGLPQRARCRQGGRASLPRRRAAPVRPRCAAAACRRPGPRSA